MKTNGFDKRKYNTPPSPNSAIKRFTTTVSARIEKELILELERLLKRRYGNKKVPMNSLSFIIRTAIKRKIRDLNSNLY